MAITSLLLAAAAVSLPTANLNDNMYEYNMT
jgi:hypothetical protein